MSGLPFFMVWGLLGYQQQKSPNKGAYASVTVAVHVALLHGVYPPPLRQMYGITTGFRVSELLRQLRSYTPIAPCCMLLAQ
jgi:hypothetical protein